MPMAQCDVGADPFISKFFHDCVYSARDYTGFVFGLASIATWMVAQFPQIVRNFRTKSAEALSPWFLAEWLLGDTCNLIGCLLTGDQLATQTYTAMYFICTDILLVMQYIYYGTLLRRRQRALRSRTSRRRTASEESGFGEELSSRYPLVSQLGQTPKPRAFACIALLVVGGRVMLGDKAGLHSQGQLLGGYRRHLLSGTAGLLDSNKPAMDWTKSIGQLIGWISSFFYLGSRLSQIYKNWSRQSAEGLSLAMFVCAVSANLLYGFGILLRTYAWADLVSSAPWLLGSLGTVFLDLVIFSQFARYQKKAPEQDPLLEEGASD